MKSVIIISLGFVMLFGSLFPKNNAQELAKLQSLVEHFNEHQSKSAGFSFFDFIRLHYFDEEHHQHAEEHNLPFLGMVHAVTLFLNSESFAFEPTLPVVSEVGFTFLKDLYQYTPELNLLQPPRL